MNIHGGVKMQRRQFGTAFELADNFEPVGGIGGQFPEAVQNSLALHFDRMKAARQRAGKINRLLDQFHKVICRRRLGD